MRCIFVSFCYFGIFNFGFAQVSSADSSKTYRFVGIDLGRTIFANIWQPTSSGYTIEAIYRQGRRDPDRVGLGCVFSAGYSRFSQDTVYNNTDYNCEGYFGKAGFENGFWSDSWPFQRVFYGFGLNLVLAQVRNYGYFRIPGNYFSEFRKPFESARLLSAIQFHAQVIYPIYKKMNLGLNLNFAFLINPTPKNSLNSISYYSPGIGITQNNKIGGGLGLQFFYSIN